MNPSDCDTQTMLCWGLWSPSRDSRVSLRLSKVAAQSATKLVASVRRREHTLKYVRDNIARSEIGRALARPVGVRARGEAEKKTVRWTVFPPSGPPGKGGLDFRAPQDAKRERRASKPRLTQRFCRDAYPKLTRTSWLAAFANHRFESKEVIYMYDFL